MFHVNVLELRDGDQCAKRDLRKENIFPAAYFHCQLLQRQVTFLTLKETDFNENISGITVT